MNPPVLFRSGRPVPAVHQSNFRHLYLDIAWFGLLAASSLAFAGVYGARLGANAFQLGLLSVGPGLANLLFALPAGRWLEKQPIDAAVFWMAVVHRIGYALWPVLPFLLGAQGQVWALIGLTLVMHVPGTAVGVGFNALFADAVPPDWRGHVAGVRNALLAVGYIVMSLVCGQILNRLAFPVGYQVIFALGFIGAAMSTVQLWYIVPCPDDRPPPRPRRRLSDLTWPRLRRAPGTPAVAGQRARQPLLNTTALRGPYGKLLAVIFAFHVSLYLAVPLFPLHWVNVLHLSDGEIGLGTALFYVAVFFGSSQLARLTQRLGNQRATALGAVFMAFYPAFMAAARGLPLFLAGSLAGGLGWSLVGGALVNYVLEKVPRQGRAAHLSWYNLAVNGALVVGALIGPFIANHIGLVTALAVFAVLRLLASIAIARWE